MTEVLAEEDEPEVFMMTMETSIEEAEHIMRMSERLRQWRRQCVYGQRVLTTKMSVSSE